MRHNQIQVSINQYRARNMKNIFNSDQSSITHHNSLIISNTGHLTFNKSCCGEIGLPSKCLWLCQLDLSSRSLAPPSKCDKYAKRIKEECVMKGWFNLRIDYVLMSWIILNLCFYICIVKLKYSIISQVIVKQMMTVLMMKPQFVQTEYVHVRIHLVVVGIISSRTLNCQ